MLACPAVPITRSAEKRMRADRKLRFKNLALKSELKTLTKKFLGLLQKGSAAEAKESLRLLTKRLDQAAQKHLIHRHTVSRKVSRFARHLHRLSGSQAQTKK